MKTNLVVKKKTVRLYADDYRSEPVGTLTLPDYDEKPDVVICGDTVYKIGTYPYDCYHATLKVHVAAPADLIPPAPPKVRATFVPAAPLPAPAVVNEDGEPAEAPAGYGLPAYDEPL